MSMRIVGLFFLLVALAGRAMGQELTTAQVLAKLDEKAKAFTSLEAALSQGQVVVGLKHPVESGKIFMKLANGNPSVLIDITNPKTAAKTALVKGGKAMIYFRETRQVMEKTVDPKSNQLQLLLMGFGTSSDSIKEFYSPQVIGRETVDGVQAVVLELNSISKSTGDYTKVTLWLDTKAWTPVQTRITELSKDYTDFKYSNVKLNKGVSDSVFNVKIPSDAMKK